MYQRILSLLATSAILLLATGAKAASPYATLQGTFLPHADPAAGNAGQSVAMNGDFVVIGAPRAKTGVVVVYRISTGAKVATLLNPSKSTTEQFGYAVALSGNKVAVGVPFESTSASNAGVVFVYDLANATPSVPILTLRDPAAASEYFGMTVALSGSRLLVGAPYATIAGKRTGAVYAYDLASGQTTPATTLNSPTPADSQAFGLSLAVDGGRAVVGTGSYSESKAFLFNLQSATPGTATLIFSNPTGKATGLFGASVAISGSRVAIGAPGNDEGATGAGAAYLYEVAGTNPTTPTLTFATATPVNYGGFGMSVALTGNRLAVGAHSFNSSASGIVNLFDLGSASPTRSGTTFVNPAPSAYDGFGDSLVLSSTRVVIGAPFNDAGVTDAGAAYLFDLTATQPSASAVTYTYPATNVYDRYGRAVAMYSHYMVVGAYGNAGTVYVYDLTSTTPATPFVTLRNPGKTGNNFGRSVAISNAGFLDDIAVVVGAELESTDSFKGVSIGAAYVYTIKADKSFNPPVKVTNPRQASGDITYDYFGFSVGVTSSHVIVGAYNDYTGAASAGSVFVFHRDYSGVPSAPTAVIRNPHPSSSANFGYAVATDGRTLLVGSPYDSVAGANTGAVYVYDLDDDLSSEPPFAALRRPTPQANCDFGAAVAISSGVAIVGADGDDVATNGGAAYQFYVNYTYSDTTSYGTGATFVRALPNPNPSPRDAFGFPVAIENNTIVIGASRRHQSAPNAGGAYVYSLDSATPSVPEATLLKPTPVAEDRFGYGVAVSQKHVAVGVLYDDTLDLDEGAVYVYGDPVGVPPAPDIALEAPAGTPLPAAAGDYGVVVPASSVTKTFTIRNAGGATLSNISAALQGGDANSFAITTQPAVSVAPGATTNVSVKFTPLNPGDKLAALRINSNDPDENPYILSLKGIGNHPPSLTLPPSPLTLFAPNESGANVTYNVTANDAEDGALVPTSTPATGSLFAVGDTVVNVSAKDAQGVVSSGSFVVRVLPPPADLTVAQLTLTPASAARSGDTISISWQDANAGVATSHGGWFDSVKVIRLADSAVVYSTSLFHDPATEGELKANAKLNRVVNCPLPDGVAGAGSFRVEISTDATNLVAEDNGDHSAESNNTAALPFTATLRPYPDLQVFNLATSPVSPSSGNGLDVRWTSKNTGNASASEAFADHLVVRNVDRNEVIFDDYIGGGVNATLGAGQGRARTARVSLPTGPRGAGALSVTVTGDGEGAIAEYNSSDTGESNNTATLTIQSALAPFADLVVTSITVPPPAAPGQSVDVLWSVKNQGTADAPAGWIDRVFASPDARIGDDTALVASSPAAALAAGQSIVHRATIVLPMLRAGAEYLVVRTNAGNDPFEGDFANNSFMASTPFTVTSALRLALGRTSVSESQGAFNVTVSRNGDNAQPLIVKLQSGPAGSLVIPASVTIAAHEDTAEFSIAPLDNQRLDGTRRGTITASALPYGDVTASLEITDDDVPSLNIAVSPSTVIENAGVSAVRGTVTRNTGTNADLVVSLFSNQPGVASVPASITIPAGALSATFPVTIYDDDVLTSDRSVRLTASGSGLATNSTILTVTDDDIPGVSLRLTPASVPESAPNPAAFGHIVRDHPSDREVVFQLLSSDSTQAAVPATVSLPAGATEVNFPINVVDNNKADGPRDVTISATETDRVLHQPVPLQTDQRGLHILDDEGPTLMLSASAATVPPGQTIAGTVSRPAGASGALTVALLSSDQAIMVPASIQIAAGASQASFSIKASSGLPASLRVTLTASSAGYNSAAIGVTALVTKQADLSMVSVTPSSQSVRGGEPVDVVVLVENDGSAPATGNWSDRVYLTSDRQSLTGPEGVNIPASGPLAAGTGYSHTAHLTAPAAPGLYWAVAMANVPTTLSEGSLENNTLISAQPVLVGAAYRVTVASAVQIASSGSQIALQGQAINNGDNSPAAQVPVTVRVLVEGTRRTFYAITDDTGHYLVNFPSLPMEAGHYTVAAAQPEVKEDVVQARFELVGVSATPTSLDLRLGVQQPLSGEITLTNLSDHVFSGLTATLVGAASNITATLSPPASLAGKATGTLRYSFTAANDTIQRARLAIHLASPQGLSTDIPVAISVVPAASQLVTNPGVLSRGMLVGTATLLDFELINLGAAPTGNLTLEKPAAFSWLSLVSPATVPSLAPGEHARVTLQLHPEATLPLQLYTGTLVARAAQSALAIPFQFRAISEATGDVRVTVSDDYTYYAPGAPLVSGATVRLRDAVDQSIIVAEGVTDAAGTLLLSAVAEGPYYLEVSAAKHGTLRQGMVVTPGIINSQNVFIERQTVTYTWQVVPTEVPDRYEIKLISTFEVDVPVPVVTMELSNLAVPELAAGESLQIDMKLENYGLIAAQEVQLHFPGLESGFEFKPLVSRLDKIDAKSNVTIPVVIRRTTAGVVSRAIEDAPRFAGPGAGGGGGVPCIDLITADYSYDCGGKKITKSAAQGITFEGRVCGSGPIEGGGGGGGGIIPIGSDAKLRNLSVSGYDPCDPCSIAVSKAILDCAYEFLPASHTVRCLYTEASCIYDAVHRKYSTGVTCIGAGIHCTETIVPGSSILVCAVALADAYLECQAEESGNSHEKRKVARYSVSRQLASAAVAGGATYTASAGANFAPVLEHIARLSDTMDALAYNYGDSAWLQGGKTPEGEAWINAAAAALEQTSSSAERISDSERAALMGMPLPYGITAEMATRFLDRLNRTIDYNAKGIFISTQVAPGNNTDFFALDVANDKFTRGKQAYELSKAEGFQSPEEALVSVLKDFAAQPPPRTQGVCARVKIEIDQQAVLTRNAFAGTLEITNGSQAGALQDVGVTLDIRDVHGNSANDKFFIQGPEVSGLSSAGGGGVLAAGTTGRLQYTFIPKTTAAPEAPTVYEFAGTVHYNDNGQQISMPLAPAPITVYPDAKLVLKYFQQRDVYADDPFTPEVEPAEPFALGLIVTNEGRGTAKNFSITSAQPKIIDNKKGLLIDFKIIGTQVGPQQLDPSLTVDLGNIAPGESQVAQFLLTASLQGKFIDYQASYEHSSELGGAATSLVDSVEIHELIHVARANTAGSDDLPDFLVNDDADAASLPDTLYLSTGAKVPVNLGSNAVITPGQYQAQITAQMPSGWGYLELPDPGAGAHLARVVRSDGVVLRIADNVWQTDRSFPNSATGAKRQRLVHLLDFDSTGAYTLFYTEAQAPGTLLPPVQIAHLGPVLPAVREAALDAIDLTFSRLIDSGSFTAADVSLRLNGGPAILTAGNISVTSLGEATYRISGLAPFNAGEGTYVLTVRAGTINDLAGHTGQGSASVIWALSTSHVAVLSAGGFGGATIRGPLAGVDLVFSRAVDPGTLSFDDVTLTRDGGSNLITSGISVTKTSPTTFRLGGLSGLTNTSGVYALTVRASSVADLSGVSGVGSLTETFTVDNVGPTIAGLDEIAPNPRNTAISSLDLSFSKPVVQGSFTGNALTLTRNGAVISLGSARLNALDEQHFQITGLAESTGLAGSYRLVVSAAGVRDALGNAGFGKMTRAWTVKTTRPSAPDQLAITPDSGSSAQDHLINVRTPAITGHVIPGIVLVRATDTTSGNILGHVAVSGAGTFKLPVLLGTAGLHDLALEALDASGNVSPASKLRVFVDLSGPTSSIAQVVPSPRSTPVSALAIHFSEPINPATFTLADVQLKRDGTSLPLQAPIALVFGAPGECVLQGLAALTDKPGIYEVSILTMGVKDLAGNMGTGVASATWRRLKGDNFQQFGAYAGTYTGLIQASGELAHDTSGIASFTLSRLGGFTGAITYGGRKTNWKGVLDREGRFTGIFDRGGDALTVSIALATETGANALTGTVSGLKGSAGFIADRLLFSPAAPTPLAGQYTALLPPSQKSLQPQIPTAQGFATITISPGGQVRVSGELADGGKFSQGSTLGGLDEWPFYAVLQAGRGSGVGQIYCRPLVEQLSDLDGTLAWYHARASSPAAFSTAFTSNLAFRGARYNWSPTNTNPFDFGNLGQQAKVVLAGGSLAQEVSLPFVFSKAGVANFSMPGTLQPILNLVPATGLLRGSAVLPGDKKPTTFQGVLYAPLHEGAGYFLRSQTGGTLTVAPAP